MFTGSDHRYTRLSFKPFQFRLYEKRFGDWWDAYSNQPYVLPTSAKPRNSVANLFEYSKVAATALTLSLPVALRFLTLKHRPRAFSADEFVGLSISPSTRYASAIQEMVEELGAQELLLRIPAWDTENLDRYVAFAQSFPGKRFLINILQNRERVERPDQWRANLKEIYSACNEWAGAVQIGNAINRSKWGCAHSGEYLRLLEIASEVAADYPHLKLLGSSVIDFEPLVTTRTLIHFRRFKLNACAAQMYINRRGSAFGKQYGYFNLERKLKLTFALANLSNRCESKLWITETNWPLLDTKPYTPNSGNPRSTVDEATQAKYLKQYYQIAWQTGWVEKVYWWQLINPGYGLVDSRGGKLRKMPSYYAFKEILHGGLG